MLGNIVGIKDGQILINLNIELDKLQNLINMYVIMEDHERQCIGEIVDIKDGQAYINMLGELIDGKFVYGIIHNPSFGASIKLISKEKIPLIIGVENYRVNEHLYLGESALYPEVKVGVGINDFFSNHFAIFGSTGSGKSCSIARIFQNLFEKQQAIAYRASVFIFDAYGEYHQAFQNLGTNNPNISFKSYTTNLNFPDSEIIKLPPWLLTLDDYALLLSAESSSQLPIIEKALKLVSVFAREEEDVLKHKNDSEKAMVYFDRALKLNPDFKNIISILKGNLENDIHADEYSDEANRLIQEGMELKNENKLQDSLDCFKKAIEVDKNCEKQVSELIDEIKKTLEK